MNKWYSAFLFRGITSKQLHVTHKFLGDQTEENTVDIVDILDDYFSAPRRVPQVVFNKEAFFGENSDQRVLLPQGGTAELLLPDLREILDPYRRDDFTEYLPHVTTNLDTVQHSMDRYALMCDGRVVRFWRLQG